MKKSILFSFAILGTSLMAFSQNTSPGYSELKNGKFNFEQPQNNRGFLDIPFKGFGNDTVYFKKYDSLDQFPDLNPGETNLFKNQDNLEIITNPEPKYSMRIIKPSGNYLMKIHEPDSTKNHTLLIKEY
ncbi:hypothetical protein LZF95_07610 [Algoriphagus sp. AGSA1]|uniref:hypothetical protein n=1 Tax=Algoriphagus sp. AGSA1 TaxID=2907213 RepID=UPI001F2D8CE6|nr:hypothetical protein [Algoriphagus sp. AGSA1]MCE7054535.1 hypothetical protein [Algoriphagus sp. AGSA1]